MSPREPQARELEVSLVDVGSHVPPADLESSGGRSVQAGGLDLEWRNIECYVSDSGGEKKCWENALEKAVGWDTSGPPTKQILQGASGFACRGEILAVMGPSGSGKTTLLNVMAQRPTLGRKGYWKGELRLNGRALWKDWERDMAYVMQKDIFYDELSVRENLLYTALLRLPCTWSEAKKLERLEQLSSNLGLEKVMDTRVGTAVERGLSGGEVKRTSIANESLSMPRLFLLDEPLTGLDSSRAVEVMTSLRRVAREQGTTVMLTIHQPSSALYECFDKLLLMGPGGRTAFFGGVAEAVAHFSSIGHPVPALWAPSDHFIEMLADSDICAKVCDVWTNTDAPPPPKESDQPPSLAPMPPLSYQVRVLLPRAFKRITRSYLTAMQFKMHLGLSVVWGFIYFGVGHKLPDRLDDFVGAVFFIVAHWSWTPLFQGLGNFPREKEMLTKEKASRVYDIKAFFLSQVIAETPTVLVLPLLFFAVVWPMASMPWSVLVQVYFLIALNIQVCSAMSMLISAVCMDPDTAISVAIVVMVFAMCAGGYFADMTSLPAWIGWVRLTSPYYYIFGAIMRVMLVGPFSEELHAQALDGYSFSDLGYTAEVIVLCSMWLIFRLAALIQLKFSKKLRFS